MGMELSPKPSEDNRPVSVEDANTVVSWLKELVRQAQLVWRLFWDPRVPWPSKVLPPAVLAYVLLPIDVMPDVALGLGQLDDLAVILLGFKLFVELAPGEVVREHLRALGARITEWQENNAPESDVIEGDFEVKDTDSQES
ncbi:MAG: DUF1232 domain-containing protein [Anaerolineae bacterium]|nr:DUF1232 domain-containing protein [Anaerolineae bacterium]